MVAIEFGTLGERIRALSFDRGTPEQVAAWREDMAESRANLVIEGMIPTKEEDAMFALMLDEGIPPALMSLIIREFYD